MKAHTWTKIIANKQWEKKIVEKFVIFVESGRHNQNTTHDNAKTYKKEVIERRGNKITCTTDWIRTQNKNKVR